MKEVTLKTWHRCAIKKNDPAVAIIFITYTGNYKAIICVTSVMIHAYHMLFLEYGQGENSFSLSSSKIKEKKRIKQIYKHKPMQSIAAMNNSV